MEFLAKYYNMTVYFYEYEAIPEGRFFLLDINPNFRYRELDDWQNVIDARWVDMETGLYVDITAARYSENVAEHGAMMFDKSGHWFRVRTADTFADCLSRPPLGNIYPGHSLVSAARYDI